jgi:outer membrane lipoprotein-sorting protein
MDPHNVTNEQLVQLVLGELTSQEAHELEAHVRQCEQCEQQITRLRKLLDCADRMSALPHEEPQYESANRKVLLAVNERNEDQSRRRLESRAALLGRILMSNRIAKLAVAAVVALAVILGVSLFTSSGTASAYAKVADLLHNARTLTYSMISVTGVETMPTVRMDIAFEEPGCLRTATADGYITVVQATQDGVKGISLVPGTKSYVVFQMAHVPDDPGKNPWATVEKLRALPAQADEVLGRKEIDGRMLDGYRVHQTDATTTVWIDPRTGDLVRAELGFANAPGMNMILSDLQVDVELPEALFSLAPPEGYQPVQVQADMSTVTEKDFIEYLRLWSSWTVDGSFPPTVSGAEIAKIAIEMGREGKFRSPLAPGYDATRQQDVMFRGMAFMGTVPSGAWRYAGQNVCFGDPATPVFWYQPQGSATWRVIYADLHVADVAPQDLPK